MAAVPSTMIPLGTELPRFKLANTVDGRPVSSDDFHTARGLLVMFICNHCPYVKHIRPTMVQLVHELMARGIAAVAINANSTKTHPQDGPASMKELALEENWKFPFLFDETQEVARAFRAACTPEFYLFGPDGKLFYRGQFDDARPSSPGPVTGRDLRAAAEALLNGQPPPEPQRASIGCNIKWHPGAEPEYFPPKA